MGSGVQSAFSCMLMIWYRRFSLSPESDVHGIRYIAPTSMVTIAELAEQIRQIVNPSLTLQFDTTQPEGSRSIAVLPMHATLESLQWTPLADGLRETTTVGSPGKVMNSLSLRPTFTAFCSSLFLSYEKISRRFYHPQTSHSGIQVRHLRTDRLLH